jgi:NAD(P)-dependent dehydrogenase (short-subunit alcohol dehydrogenase family)
MNMTKTALKVALVTGASAGMGKDFCLRLIEEGYIVYGAARRIAAMADIVSAGGFALGMDVTDEASMVAGVDHILREHGRIDVLVNNAGYGAYGSIEDVPISEARRQVEVNLFGLARMTQLVLPTMRAQQAGRIVNISSVGGKCYSPLGGWYHATKHAVEGFSDCLRYETRAFGIQVVVIEPGGVESEWQDIAMDSARRFSGHTAYAPLVAAWQSASSLKGAPPSVISDLLVKAVSVRKPKTRYSAGTAAKFSLFTRAILSDRLFDGMLRLAFRVPQGAAVPPF